MPDANSAPSKLQRRRSERVSASVPLLVRGIDLLGQPFEESTSTTALNLHGCRYRSKHHLPKNTWVTIELARGPERRNVRARVAWVQRPHSVRESFQIALELETPGNIWGIEAPDQWRAAAGSLEAPGEMLVRRQDLPAAGALETETRRPVVAGFAERAGPESGSRLPDAASAPPAPAVGEFAPAFESPLLEQWKAEIQRQASGAAEAAASQAADQVRRALEDLERAESAARETVAAQWEARQQEILDALHSELDQRLRQAHDMLRELEEKAQALRTESESFAESAKRLAEARLQAEAAEAERARQAAAIQPYEVARERAVAEWRERLESEMALAKAQWHELLQSSLDTGIEKLAERLSSRSEDVLREADQRLSVRLAELREPLAQVSELAREALSGIKTALDDEVSRARAALGEIQQSASRVKEHAAQLEAASQDSVNELHRRLENILEAQTDELRRRAENAGAELPQRLAPMLDSLGQRMVERTVTEVEAKLAARTERIPELLRELAARELQAEESLRLHRERLRQVSENHQREIAGQTAALLAGLRGDFESARTDALAKWKEELEAGGVRASHAAAESIGRTSEWLQQEARVKLQELAEQMLAAARSGFEEKTSEAAGQFGARLEEQTSGRLAEIQQRLEAVAGEVAGRARSQFSEAAEASAASFGQVLRGISEEEIRQFAEASHGVLRGQEQEMARRKTEALYDLETKAGASMYHFREQMAAQLEATMAEGRRVLAGELAGVVEGYRAERDAHEKEWAGRLVSLSDEALEKCQDRLQTAGDSWLAASARRLNEHGQDVMEALLRSADRALRDSFSKVFEGLAEMLRERTTNAAGVVGFTPGSAREAPQANASHTQAAATDVNP